MNNTDFIDVTAKFDARTGKIIPLSFVYNHQNILIDKVLDIRPAASLKHGGQGIRYTCRASGKNFYLFLEENKWFIEQI